MGLDRERCRNAGPRATSRPSTKKFDPVAKLDLSEARKIAIPSRSSGWPTAADGMLLRAAAPPSPGRRAARAVSSVTIEPGTMPLRGCRAGEVGGHDAGQAHHARLGSASRRCSRRPPWLSPVGDPVLMIEPPSPLSIMSRAPCLQVRKTPRRLTAMGALPDVELELVDRRVLADELDGGARVEHVEATMAAADLIERGGDAGPRP